MPDLELGQVADAWLRSIVETVRGRSIPVASLLAEATPTELAGDTLTLEFPAGNDFHRQQIAEPQNIGLLRDALYEVTGKRLTVVLEAGDTEATADEDDEPKSEDDFISTLKETFDAREVDERMSFDMNKMLREAQRMQEELVKAQEEAATEVVEASAGGGMVTVKANGAGEVVSITIDPRAIDPDDPELLADMILAAVNEALRSARGLMESKMSGLMPAASATSAACFPAASRGCRGSARVGLARDTRRDTKPFARHATCEGPQDEGPRAPARPSQLGVA